MDGAYKVVFKILKYEASAVGVKEGKVFMLGDKKQFMFRRQILD